MTDQGSLTPLKGGSEASLFRRAEITRKLKRVSCECLSDSQILACIPWIPPFFYEKKEKNTC